MNLCTRCRMILALHMLMLFCIDLVPILVLNLSCFYLTRNVRLKQNLPNVGRDEKRSLQSTKKIAGVDVDVDQTALSDLLSKPG